MGAGSRRRSMLPGEYYRKRGFDIYIYGVRGERSERYGNLRGRRRGLGPATAAAMRGVIVVHVPLQAIHFRRRFGRTRKTPGDVLVVVDVRCLRSTSISYVQLLVLFPTSDTVRTFSL